MAGGVHGPETRARGPGWRRAAIWFGGGVLAGALAFLWWERGAADATAPDTAHEQPDQLTEILREERRRHAGIQAELDRLRRQLESFEETEPHGRDAAPEPR